MNKLFIVVVAIAMALIAIPAHADMTYAPFLFDGYDAQGNAISNGTYAMIIDLDGDGWDGNSYLEQSTGADNSFGWLWDNDDMLLDLGQITNGEAYPFAQIASANIPATYNIGVDNYYLMWFNTPYDSLAAGPGAGISYGVELLGQVGKDPGNYAPFAIGGNANLTTISTQVIPEPISAILALIGAGAMALRRRFVKV